VEPLLTLAVVLYCVNAVLFGFLAYVYGKTAISTKARYPAGLFVFAILLLVQTAGTAAAYVFLGEYFGHEAFPAMSMMAAVEFAGVLALLRITL
jgi:hypothetical protein